MLKINGVKMPIPSAFSVDVEDIDGESVRTASGILHRERIGTKRKLKVEYVHLKQNEISTIYNAMTSVFFSVEYPDPQLGVVTKTFYVGGRTAPMYTYKDGVGIWEKLSFNLIER